MPRRADNGRHYKAPEKKRDDAREGIKEHVPDPERSGPIVYAASSRHQQSYCNQLLPSQAGGCARARKVNMSKKMLIDATHAEETRVVVVDGNKVEEFDFESENKRQLAGNIYLAKSNAGRAFASGRVCGLWRQSPRFPRVLGNSP